MRADQGPLLLWLLLTSSALQAAPADPAEDLAFLEFLALMVEDGDDWIDPLTAGEALPRQLETAEPERQQADAPPPLPARAADRDAESAP